MAGKLDNTRDMLHFEEQFKDEALKYIQDMKFTKARLKISKDMNGCLR